MKTYKGSISLEKVETRIMDTTQHNRIPDPVKCNKLRVLYNMRVKSVSKEHSSIDIVTE